MNPAPEFAIGALEPNVTVSLWCRWTHTSEKGRHFECLNGAWGGWIDQDEKLCIAGDQPRDVLIIWHGKVPTSFSHYNDAIPWIEKRIQGLV